MARPTPLLRLIQGHIVLVLDGQANIMKALGEYKMFTPVGLAETEKEIDRSRDSDVLNGVVSG
jgi:hypothetical protein